MGPRSRERGIPALPLNVGFLLLCFNGAALT